VAYDERLADQVRAVLTGVPGLQEKRMFGGLCFLVHGNMACGIVKDVLMVRVGPDAYGAALTEPHAREMDFTGRPLKGMVYVDSAGVQTPKTLSAWVKRGVAFAGALPQKRPKGPKR